MSSQRPLFIFQDNACVESFFGTLKKEPIHHRRYLTREEARQEIFEYIELFYKSDALS